MRSTAIIASALLIVISSRASSSSASCSAESNMSSAASISPARTLATAARRSSSARVRFSDIPTVPVSLVRFPAGLDLLRAFEFDEALDLFLRGGAESSQLVEHRLRAISLFEEIADAEVERLQDFQQRVQSDFVFALFHARKIGLMNADALGQLDLRELALA